MDWDKFLQQVWYGAAGYFLAFWPQFVQYIMDNGVENFGSVTTVRWVMLFGSPLFATIGMIYARSGRDIPKV